jgi:cell division protein FtsN
MRQNVRVREHYELSLDGRQVASIVVGALVLLGAVFVLGLHLGRQLGAAAPPARPENPLAALDRQPAAPAEAREKEPRLSFHDALTKGSPETAPVAEPRPPRPDPGTPVTGTALNALPPVPAAAPPAPAQKPRPAPAPAAPRRDAMAAAVAKVSALPAAAGPAGRFAVQVGATQSEAEAQRLQRRLAAHGARVVVADVPGKGRWYRIKVGSYETRGEAEQRRAVLASEGVKGFVTDGK